MHLPVLVNEVVESLQAGSGGTFFDGTVGLGGHVAAVLAASPHNFVYGTDRDSEALAMAEQNLAAFTGRIRLFRSDFRELASLPIEVAAVDGFLFDLGVSSYQLDTPGRGFSYSQPAPLDMRMDRKQELTAGVIVNEYSHRQLADVFSKYGEFRDPSRLVDQVIFHRKMKRIESSAELKEIVRRVYPRQKTMDPLSRVFQALRIEVNGELEGLQAFFFKLLPNMKPGARLVIISFHSLEDRIAKSVMKKAEEENLVEILTRKPVTAGEEEQRNNPRSRSAKLRVCRKI